MPRHVTTTLFKLAPLACACLIASGARTPSHAQGSPPASVKIDNDLARGIELFNRGDVDGASKALRKATASEATNAEAWHYLGMALGKQGEMDEARQAFETAVRLRPNFVPSLNGLAFALITQNYLPRAEWAAHRTLKLDPQNVEAHYLLALISLRQSAYVKALEEADTVLRLNPASPPVLLLKGEALVGMGGDELNSAADETADVRAALLEKGAAHLAEAGTILRKVLQINSKNADALSLLQQIDVLREYREGYFQPADEGVILTRKEVTSKAVILDAPEPLYTPEARRNRMTGSIRLRMVLGADGTISRIFALRSLPYGLTEVAINAARKIKFTPAMKDSQRVSQYAAIEYNFVQY